MDPREISSLDHLKTVDETVRKWALEQPDAPVFLEDGKAPLSYAQLARVMDTTAAALGRAGLGRGSRIAVVAPSGTGLASVLVGVCAVATVVPTNPDFTVPEFESYFSDCGVDALIIENGDFSAARNVAADMGIPVLEYASTNPGGVSIFGGPEEGKGRAEPAQTEDILWLLSTSGTTAGRRIVPARHGPWLGHLMGGMDSEVLRPSDRSLIVRPLFYAAGLGVMLTTCMTGGSAVFLPRFETQHFFRLLAEAKPTWFSASKTLVRDVLSHAVDHRDYIEKSALRMIVAPLGPDDGDLADELERTFSTCLIESYSCTEVGIISQNLPDGGRAKRGTVGIPTGIQVQIVGPDGKILSTGEIGEILVRGEQVFTGYENDPEVNREVFIDGWFRTGDEGFFDDDGYLTLAGRIKEMINRGGEKVSPAEVDAVLMGHPEVRDAATFPVPHPTLGEEVAAVVVLEPNAALNVNGLRAYLLERISGFKIPKQTVFADVIPKGPTGKVQRHKLAETFGVRIRTR
jgi:acyl-CoA synthetase (AMP-forming)/AMP-acid ligase II